MLKEQMIQIIMDYEIMFYTRKCDYKKRFGEQSKQYDDAMTSWCAIYDLVRDLGFLYKIERYSTKK
jgi:hypothetical protein